MYRFPRQAGTNSPGSMLALTLDSQYPQDLNIETDVYVGSRALPTVTNAFIDYAQVLPHDVLRYRVPSAECFCLGCWPKPV